MPNSEKTKDEIVDESSTIFAIDNSGSMMMNDSLKNIKKVLATQIDDMVKRTPDKKVGIITFENYVEIIGDGNFANSKNRLEWGMYDHQDRIIDYGEKQSDKCMGMKIKDSW